MVDNLDVGEQLVEGFDKCSNHRIMTFDRTLRIEMKTVQK